MPIAARAPARHPVLQLVAKELRLQQMALLLCALYGAIWLAALCCAPAWYWGYWWGLTLFYSTFAGLLVGAAASAEERHLGTLEWQLLVPVRSWVQWTVKAAVVFGLALAFSIGVPRVLAQLLAAWGIAGPDPTLTLPLSTMLLVAACGFYASSISRSSLAAVLASIPTLVAVGTVWAVVVTRLGFLPTAGTEEPFWRLSAATVSALNAVMLAGQFAVITCCAYHNHRRADRSISRVALHLAWMTLYSLAWWLGRLATGGSY